MKLKKRNVKGRSLSGEHNDDDYTYVLYDEVSVCVSLA